MKTHFKEEYSNAYYEFIETDEIPKKDLVTCVFAFVSYKGKVYLTKKALPHID